MSDLQELHRDMQLQAQRLEEICEAAKVRPLSYDEVTEILAALGLMRKKHG